MGQFDGVRVNKSNGGLGRKNPTSDGTALLIIGSGVAATGLAINTVEKLLALENAEDIGINASYDDTNDILAHYHIDEFFRVSPDGILYVVLADATFDDAALKNIINANSDIRGIGITRNDTVAVVDFSAYIGGYQNVVNDLKTQHVLIDYVLVEGNELSGATAVAAYQDLRAEAAPNVSVVGVQDPLIRALKPEYAGHAAIGTALGGLSVRGVNENLGSVNINNKPTYAKGQTTFPLTNTGRSRWLSAILQNGTTVSELTAAEKEALSDKGYIFAGSYQGISGVFLSSSPTCIEFASDYAYIENNRVWNKAARALRAALLPRVKGNLLKDTTTGFIRATEATELEELGKSSLRSMEASEEISGFDVYINPEQTIDNDTPLIVKAQVVANSIIFEFEVDLGLTNSLT